MEMRLERDIDRLDERSCHRGWARESTQPGSEDEDDLHWDSLRRHLRRNIMPVGSRSKMDVLIQRQRRVQERSHMTSSIIDKTYFDPTDPSSSSEYFSASADSDTDIDSERSVSPVSLSSIAESPTIPFPSSSLSPTIAKFLSSHRQLASLRECNFHTTLNSALLAWAILMNLITFYIYWHREHF